MARSRCPLRLSPKLYAAIAAWAEDDFRSVNGQIEYLLTECVRQRKKNGKYVSDEIGRCLRNWISNEKRTRCHAARPLFLCQASAEPSRTSGISSLLMMVSISSSLAHIVGG